MQRRMRGRRQRHGTGSGRIGLAAVLIGASCAVLTGRRLACWPPFATAAQRRQAACRARTSLAGQTLDSRLWGRRAA